MCSYPEHECVLALVKGAIYLKEDLGLLVKHGDAPNESDAMDSIDSIPHMILKGSENIGSCSEFQIMADNISICTTKTFTRALKLVFACFYIFNIAYPKQIAGFLTFIQKVLINIADNSKKNVKVVKLLSELCK